MDTFNGYLEQVGEIETYKRGGPESPTEAAEAERRAYEKKLKRRRGR